MSKSPEAKAAFTARREMRLRRDKTAALLMPFFLAWQKDAQRGVCSQASYEAARDAVKATDLLLAELDRTAKHES